MLISKPSLTAVFDMNNIYVVYSDEFEKIDYENSPAAMKGRMSGIIELVKTQTDYCIVQPPNIDDAEILNVHFPEYVEKIKSNNTLFSIAKLSAASAIKASDLAMDGVPAFSCARPPGHHASRGDSWGYCYFCNIAIALKRLRKQGRINSAFVLDFDAHTGDGTIDCLSDWKEVKILNPMADDAQKYLKTIDEFTETLSNIDIVAVSAGFDSYLLDVGKKLSTFDFYLIGRKMKELAKKLSKGRRFAALEGGYYLPDLPKNVLAFCDGFKN